MSLFFGSLCVIFLLTTNIPNTYSYGLTVFIDIKNKYKNCALFHWNNCFCILFYIPCYNWKEEYIVFSS